jgi:hypothetical protein
VRADAPELIFQDRGRAAVMRFRKSYAVEGGGQNRSGEVVQELRWRLTPQGWKISANATCASSVEPRFRRGHSSA